MKRSTIMHSAMIALGIAGAIALVGAWIAGTNGTFAGLTQEHLFWDALNLQGIAISAGVCALVYMQRERP